MSVCIKRHFSGLLLIVEAVMTEIKQEADGVELFVNAVASPRCFFLVLFVPTQLNLPLLRKTLQSFAESKRKEGSQCFSVSLTDRSLMPRPVSPSVERLNCDISQ